MKPRRVWGAFVRLFWAFALLLSGKSAHGSAVLTRDIYMDELAQGWDNWSWAEVDLQATNPVNSGNFSISVEYGAWQGLYLHHPEIDPIGYTHLSFTLHGGVTGGQQISVYLTLNVNGTTQDGPRLNLPPPLAHSWQHIRLPLADLCASGATITGIIWQGMTATTQPTVYFDDITLESDAHPDSPILSVGNVHPRSIPADSSTPLLVRVRVSDPQGAADLARVWLDASRLGRGEALLHDNGRSNDGDAGDGFFGAALTVAMNTPPGEQVLLVIAEDQEGHRQSLPLGTITVLGTPGGEIPDVLPQRIAWGSNAWSETPGQDWQVNSGVPWDYVYQYITYGWETWGAVFVQGFVSQAWDKGFIPVISVYLILGLPPECGESPSCYAQKLQDPAAVQAYFNSLEGAALQAQGENPVIFQLEPDFYGYMQQYSNANPPPPIQPDNPSSFPVAVNHPGYANTLAGFGQRMVDLLHTTAPNALVAPMASMWATNHDPFNVPAGEAIHMAERTAGFIDAMGGDRADLLFVEWSDRDAGSGLRPWWDDTDHDLPRPTRAILWENALSRAAAKRVVLWQAPAGNMSLDNTCNHYQDNRAAYAFHHPRDLFDAGVIGVLFGGGAACMTQVTTDGGYIASQGEIAYAPPSTPASFTAGAPFNGAVPLHWEENSEPDLWGYQLRYQSGSGGTALVMDVGRRNAWDLWLPWSGNWQIQVTAYDAMGNTSPYSDWVSVSIMGGAHRLFLPLISY